MGKRSILVQLDPDQHPSVFDRVVAVDSGADELFAYGGVKPEQVRDLVHGAIFTRGPKDLKRTAIFVGGSNVQASEAIFNQLLPAMVPQFGLRVSVMLDPNGSNTTAAAAVRSVTKQMDVNGKKVLLLAGTGPVGQRCAFLLAGLGARVIISSRTREKADAVLQEVAKRGVDKALLHAMQVANNAELEKALEGCEVVIATGAAGVCLLPAEVRRKFVGLKAVVDLNAVPPMGIEGVEVMDKGAIRDGVICFGAIGVGDLKMKVHRASISKLFERNDYVLDAREIYEIALGF
jgi:hypothetical protein